MSVRERADGMNNMQNFEELIKIVFLPNEENITWQKRERHEIWATDFEKIINEPVLRTRTVLYKDKPVDFSSDIQKLKESLPSQKEIRDLEVKIKVNWERCEKGNRERWLKEIDKLKKPFLKASSKSQNYPSIKYESETYKQDEDNLIKDIYKIQRYVIKREVEIRESSKKKQAIDKLRVLLPIVIENQKYYRDKKCFYDTVRRIKTLINYQNNIEHGRVNSGLEKKGSVQNKFKLSHIKSQKGLQVEHALDEIKVIMKKKYMTEQENKELYAKLLNLKADINANFHTFTGIDNISGRLNQIEQYCDKLKKMSENASKKDSSSEKHKMKTVWSFSLSSKE